MSDFESHSSCPLHPNPFPLTFKNPRLSPFPEEDLRLALPSPPLAASRINPFLVSYSWLSDWLLLHGWTNVGSVPQSGDIRNSMTPFQDGGGGCGKERGTHGYYRSGMKPIVILRPFPPHPPIPKGKWFLTTQTHPELIWETNTDKCQSLQLAKLSSIA